MVVVVMVVVCRAVPYASCWASFSPYVRAEVGDYRKVLAYCVCIYACARYQTNSYWAFRYVFLQVSLLCFLFFASFFVYSIFFLCIFCQCHISKKFIFHFFFFSSFGAHNLPVRNERGFALSTTHIFSSALHIYIYRHTHAQTREKMGERSVTISQYRHKEYEININSPLLLSMDLFFNIAVGRHCSFGSHGVCVLLSFLCCCYCSLFCVPVFFGVSQNTDR